MWDVWYSTIASSNFIHSITLLLWQSRSVRDFDQHATCLVGKFEVCMLDLLLVLYFILLFFFFSFLKEYWKKDSCHKILDVSLIYLLFSPLWNTDKASFSQTPDTYYRYSSSASFVRNVSVPLLCISALDDPLCTKEAIPYDECRCLSLLLEFFWSIIIFFFAFSQFGNLHLLFAFLVGQTKMLFLLLHGMGGIWHFLKGWLQADYGTFKAIPVQ